MRVLILETALMDVGMGVGRVVVAVLVLVLDVLVLVLGVGVLVRVLAVLVVMAVGLIVLVLGHGASASFGFGRVHGSRRAFSATAAPTCKSFALRSHPTTGGRGLDVRDGMDECLPRRPMRAGSRDRERLEQRLLDRWGLRGTRGPRTGRLLAGLVAGAALVLTGCGGEEEKTAGSPGSGGKPKLQVGTTVAPITSIVANVGGDRVQITGIVPEGTNSHTFEPKPSAAELLSEVDVLYVNGLKLEEPTKELAEQNLKQGAEVVELGTRSIPESEYAYDFSFPKEEGKPNPHLWTDPRYAMKYAEIVRDDLSKRDPDNAGYYRGNYDRFAALVGEFDGAMRKAFATLPASRRKLLTYHDAYAYFARDYGWKVIGAIQVSDFEDPSPKEVARLVDQVKAEKVPAVFGSEVFPSPVLERIGQEAGVKYVDVLRDDDLPERPGEAGHSWMGLMDFDYVTMTESLGGDASALRAFKPRNVAPDRAEYPQ
ncbi:MAG: metal ABC transporter substrate-binding protein [Thermoleophilaceae bacterium]